MFENCSGDEGAAREEIQSAFAKADSSLYRRPYALFVSGSEDRPGATMTDGTAGPCKWLAGESWLLVGARSHIARATERLLRAHDAEVWRTTRDGSEGSIRLSLPDGIPDLPVVSRTGTAVIFAAITGHAYSDETSRVNVDATIELCHALVARGWHVIFLSSDAVLPEFVDEHGRDNRAAPRSKYGLQKQAVERHVETLGDAGCVLRLSKVVNVSSAPWVSWLHDLSRGRGVDAFSDYHLSPLAVSHAADAIVAVASARSGGIWQAPGAASISYFEFLQLLRTRLNLPGHVSPACRESGGSRRGVPAQMDACRLMQAGLWHPPTFDEVCDELGREYAMAGAC